MRRTRLACLLALAVGPAAAQPLAMPAAAPLAADPTRPAFEVESAVGDGSHGGAPPTTSGGETRRGTRGGPQLQSILTRPGQDSLAVIDGKTLAPGDRLGSARLIAIGSDTVTLAGPGGRRVLRLTPAVDKTYHRAAPGAPQSGKSPPATQSGRKYP